jgi:hypothetical protein
MVDARLLLSEGVAFVGAAQGRLDTAYAAPAMTLPGWVKAHLVDGVVDSAAIAKLHFRHRKLLGEWYTEREFEDAISLLRQNDAGRLPVTALKTRLPKLDDQFFQGMS